MMRFNFLQPKQLSPLDRLRNIEIDARMRKAFALGVIMIGVAVFAGGVEQVRLSQARAIERDRTARLQNDEQRMVDLRAASDTVARLSAVAASVRATQRSGERKAAELTEIAASLPEHLWLTSIRQDASGLVIHGGARSYALIGDAMERLSRGRTANAPVLLSSGVRDNLHPDSLDYEIRLQEHVR
jgi:Tfp pilus assembly protein PilN